MAPTAHAVLESWSFPTWITALNLLAALLYLRGWIALHGIVRGRFTGSRLASFVGGIAILELALASPIDTFDSFLLTDHMLQHMLLMMIVPPLVLLGDPVIPLLHGLPRWATRNVLGPFLKWRLTQWVGCSLTYPPVSLFLMSVVMIGWHLPAPYELALRSPGWHEVEHASFLIASFLFWWPVVRPWPSRPHWNLWMLPVYLLLADFVNTALSAFLTFSDRVFYPSYLLMPRLSGVPARTDQVAAGISMWVLGSFAFLIPAVVITANLLSPARPRAERTMLSTRPESRLQSASLLGLAVLLPLAAIGYGLIAPDKIDIDGDIVRMHGVSGPLEITVFTPPDPLPKGELEVAVLIQDRGTGGPVLDAATEIQFQCDGATIDDSISATASRRRATNKILSAASVELPDSGTWNLRVAVNRGNDAGSLAIKLQIGKD
jgi:putative membrane protein